MCIANDNCEALDNHTSNSSQIETEISGDCLISELRFSAFKEWFNSEVDKRITTALNDVIKTRILPINAEITDLNKDLNDTKKELQQEVDILKNSVGNQEIDSLKEKLENADKDSKILEKVISQQQTFLETIKRDKIKNNVFMSGIHNNYVLGADGDEPTETDDYKKIVSHILSYVCPTISEADYRIIKNFESKEGFTRHSCIMEFNDVNMKLLLKHTKKLKDLEENHALRKVYIKSEQTPLVLKENTRLYNEYKKLVDAQKEEPGMHVKLEKGSYI